MESYDGSQIVVLEGLAAVRKRPGMYIGSTGTKGLHHLIWEIIDNGIDEFLAGFCTKIGVTLQADGGVRVSDNGRGIPADIHPVKHIPTERVIYTMLHAGGKFENTVYKVSGGLHGVGASVVNALSKRLSVEIHRDGNIYSDAYEKGGVPVTPLEKGMIPITGKTSKNDTGTIVTFYPDPAIFDSINFSHELICEKLQEIAFLNKGLTINYENAQVKEKRVFREDNGIASYIGFINKDQSVLHKDIIYVEGVSGQIAVEAAIQYTQSFSEQVYAYCNGIHMTDGGTPVTGLKTALTRVVNQYARDFGMLKEKDANFDGRDVRNGMIAIVSIKHPDPQFEGQTKAKLGNTDAKAAVDDVLSNTMPLFFDKNSEIIRKILENTAKSLRARTAGDKARNAALKQSIDYEAKAKLAVCTSKTAADCELYIVEGDSAGGTVKTARNRKTQAVLPLRGKILNVEKAGLERVMGNAEIKALIATLGCGIGDAFDISKLRYDKVVILTDADVDGAHIRTLLLTFFYRFLPGLISEGKIYCGRPPLYMVTYDKTVGGKRKKSSTYLFDDAALEVFRRDSSIKVDSLQRYKGLGEMDASQLFETTLNPETRLLSRVYLDDDEEADMVTDLLMGTAVPPRREFIMDEASYAVLDNWA